MRLGILAVFGSMALFCQVCFLSIGPILLPSKLSQLYGNGLDSSWVRFTSTLTGGCSLRFILVLCSRTDAPR